MDKLTALFGSLFRATKPALNPEPAGGFAAGTLVHTREELKPIEQIQVGDYVLSKPENGGELAYKKVLQTFQHEPERVIRVKYQLFGEPNRYFWVYTTLNHPFWVTDEGWTAATDLHDYWSKERKFELADGNQAKVFGTTNVYVSEQPGVGWIPIYSGDIGKPGFLWDFINHAAVANNVPILDEIDWGEHPDPYFKLPVYNLEVEDFHTYFVGEHGVWVR